MNDFVVRVEIVEKVGWIFHGRERGIRPVCVTILCGCGRLVDLDIGHAEAFDHDGMRGSHNNMKTTEIWLLIIQVEVERGLNSRLQRLPPFPIIDTMHDSINS